MATLYELQGSYAQIQQMIEEGAEGLEDILKTVEGAIEEKLEGYAMVIKNLESDVVGMKAEEKRIAERRKGIENQLERMKNAIAQTLQNSGQDKVKTEKFTFSWRKSSAVHITDETLIPKEYINVTTTISRQELAKRLKNEAIPGAELIENKSLSIR